MQNLGFAYALAPVARGFAESKKETVAMLLRHLQPFSTHPYLSGAIIGSVARMEQERGSEEEIAALKVALAAPYAAIGDSLFWGALKPFAAVGAVILAFWGWLEAAIVFLFVFNVVHFFVRFEGFVAGYRTGQGAIHFIRHMDLPRLSRWIRWLSVVLISYFACLIVESNFISDSGMNRLDIWGKTFVLIFLLTSYQLMKRGISTLGIFYGVSLLLVLTIIWW